MASRPLVACLAAIPDQEREAFLSPAASLDQVPVALSASLDRASAANLDQVVAVLQARWDVWPQEVESGSVARSLAATRLEAQSHRCLAAVLDQDGLGKAAMDARDGLEPEEGPDQDGRETAADLDQDGLALADLDRDRLEDHRAQSDAPDDIQEVWAHRARRCNTRFLHVLMPYAFFIRGF